MKKIQLSGKHGQDKYALVDDQDYEWLNQWKWHTTARCYPRRTMILRKDNKVIYQFVQLHRFIMGITDPNIIVDHKDGNPLNCQRNNIRICTQSQNCANRKSRPGSISIYKGVSRFYTKYNILWYKAQISRAGVTRQKCFRTEIEAALWYNEWSKKLDGEYAKLNIINNGH